MKRQKSKLAIAISLCGWLLFAAWLFYDYAEYQDRWIIHIFQSTSISEIHGFHVLIFLVPFIYTFLGYLVNEREKLLRKVKESEEKFRSLAIRDDLTNLHNRRGFSFLAEQQLKISNRTKKRLLLLFIDVDNLKWINDNFGHKEGDLALIQTANILKRHIRKADLLARVGGDEFAALINDMSESLPDVLCKRFEESLLNRSSEETDCCELSFSVGIAWYDPTSPCPMEELLERADKHMYRNKLGKKNVQSVD